MTKEASARKNGEFGYKALVLYSDGRTHVPITKNFPTKESACAYARKWIDANDTRPTQVRSQKVTIIPRSADNAG